MPLKETLTVAETARELNIGRSTLYVMIKSGRMPIRKLGRRTLIMRADFDAFIKALPAALVGPEL